MLSVEEIKKNIGNREWRLNNLYYITDEDGNITLFKVNKVQKIIHDALHFLNIVPKARQLGVTTFFAILYLDQILFSENKTAGIIAHREQDMKKIFKNKIRFAWDHLHPWLKSYIGKPDTNTANEMTFPNGSTIFVSMSTRSGTVQFLHISEFGYICQKYPEKAEEIVTGALNSVHIGNMISIESTAAGREGYFYKFCMDAEKLRKEGRPLTQLDYKIFFFPWWVDEKYRMDGDVVLDTEMIKYFDMLEAKHGIILTKEQKNWYVKKKVSQGEKMFSEFPSTLEEAFMKNVEGAYYSSQMNKVYRERRIRPIPHETHLSVDTWWDLGFNDFNVILFTQGFGREIRFIDVYFNQGEGLEHYYNILKEKHENLGYRYGRHNLPHDIEVHELGTGETRRQILTKLGMTNIRACEKSKSINEDIEAVRKKFSRFYFDEEKTKALTDACFNYRKEFDKKLGAFKDKPRHDDNSHIVDPLRILSRYWQDPVEKMDDDAWPPKEKDDQSFFG